MSATTKSYLETIKWLWPGVKRVINMIDTAGATDLHLGRVVQPVTHAVLPAVVTANGMRAKSLSQPRSSQAALSKEVRLRLVMAPEVAGDEMERLENAAWAIPEVYAEAMDGVAWIGWQWIRLPPSRVICI